MTAGDNPPTSSSAIGLSAVMCGEVNVSNASAGFGLLLNYPTYAT
jgi:hypothetical protein